ncbi:hypothetical protein [Acinetobacter towneri]|uniref:Uncharacterized protein n=1 Tax=Acinetobacter towneri TaxID=202956 RepID=A0A1E8E2L6_9GAMM|nr:hypothetical protein [Acinetobacter towneri]OFE43819.1 hypothetical protein BJN41_10175 [Acinetobacter towneri]
MPDIIATLYQICVRSKPDDAFIHEFNSMVSLCHENEIGPLIDRLAVHIAKKAINQDASFEELDKAINNLAGYAISKDRVSNDMWEIYLVFDDAELGDDGWQRLVPNLKKIM